ncbi:MAG: HypC/HybG/HupF family hydrogenase formation chaperone [Deltaproteobacteria bacterium CG_4_8_14_3_um_filter_51_11]|nr:HypC/HybG/HupF family hydrogenase formation chaperone [bacterium]NCP09273.1 HypC/HybG/HupF family hydrogenase formation chaperone [bacterium]OIP39071.1 MAG: hydrogenase assembly protein HypC [Desulfobacteraceae bacterium CG2_30_51_40]PIX19110.1 MAG: HypC/HybG/HupF family hydrogenase formation chaperone [Deltaproteobacteria bacterium CG_4_8_14_3_um_filter_51_11]PJB36855.1 MAG: HypC/HybG/HupF family hydrogenase formation chaperone [Deltaproteobacteria bacterium CG_4_9_14_3_um_filter_51_14]
MCLAIPARIVEINELMATVDMDGTRRQASLLLVDNAALGDYVIVHAGFAIHKIDEAQAMESLRILRDLAATMSPEPS